MSTRKNAAIDRLIQRLSDEMAIAKKYSLEQTSYILSIAVLDLKMLRHRITDEELACLSNILAGLPTGTSR
jgi:hypothetical protein